jgi:hypothetical protein
VTIAPQIPPALLPNPAVIVHKTYVVTFGNDRIELTSFQANALCRALTLAL